MDREYQYLIYRAISSHVSFFGWLIAALVANTNKGFWLATALCLVAACFGIYWGYQVSEMRKR